MSLYGLLCKTQIAIEDEKIIIITHHIIQSEIPLIEIMEIGTIILHEKYSRKGISIPQKNLFIRLIYLGSGGVGFYIKTAKKIYYLSDRENFRDFRSLYILYSTLLKYKKKYKYKFDVFDTLRWDNYWINDKWLPILWKYGPRDHSKIQKK